MVAIVVAASPSVAEPYRLGPGDQVSIYVDGRLSLRERLEIDESGAVAVDRVGYVDVGGLTAGEASRRVGERLVALEAGQGDVTVVIEERRPFYIDGAVVEPGSYPHRPGLTVARAVALAEGLDVLRASQVDRSVVLDMQRRLMEARRTISEKEAVLARIDAFFSEEPLAAYERAAVLLADEGAGAKDRIAAERDRLVGALESIEDRRRETAERQEVMDQQLDMILQRRGEIEAIHKTLVGMVEEFVELRERGLGTTASLSDARRDMSSSRADLLQADQAYFFVLSEKRRLDGLLTDSYNEVANEMRRERLQAMTDRDGARLVAALLQSQLGFFGIDRRAETGLPSYAASIQRFKPDGMVEIEATPGTPVLPGDVLRIEPRPVGGEGAL